MSAILLLVLVLLSTLGQAPPPKEHSNYSCLSDKAALPCEVASSPRVISQLSEARPHSLFSSVSSHFSVSLSFFNPVSVATITTGGVGVLFLLGLAAWAIIMSVWIVCTAVVSRINPLTHSLKKTEPKTFNMTGTYM